MAADRIDRRAGAARPKGPARDNGSSEIKRGVAAAAADIANKSLSRSRLTDTLFLAHLFATRFPEPQPDAGRSDTGDNASYRKSAKRPAKKRRILTKKV